MHNYRKKLHNDFLRLLQILSQINLQRILHVLPYFTHIVRKTLQLKCSHLRNAFNQKALPGIWTYLAILAKILIAAFQLVDREKAGYALMERVGSLTFLTLYPCIVLYWSRSIARWWLIYDCNWGIPPLFWWFLQRYQTLWSFLSFFRFPLSPSPTFLFHFLACLQLDISKTHGNPPACQVWTRWMKVYLLKDFTEIFDHIVGRKDPNLPRIVVNCLHFAKHTPLITIFFPTLLWMFAILKEQSERRGIEEGLESGVEKTSIPKILQSGTYVFLLHVEALYNQWREVRNKYQDLPLQPR